MPTCSICGEEREEYDMINGICVDCASAMMQEDGIDLGLGFE